MKLATHKTSWHIVPMFIIQGDVDLITNYIWSNTTSVDTTTTPCEFLVKKETICCLDPGGMYNFKIPHTQFKIGSIEFDIQLSRIEDVLYCMEYGTERIPGYIRFRQWKYFVILPKLMFLKLKEKLEELEKSDEAMNAELTEKNIYDELCARGIIISPKKKRNI